MSDDKEIRITVNDDGPGFKILLLNWENHILNQDL